MHAIVLTVDKYRALTDHMIFKYEQLWPDHPFQFRVPYQDLAPTIIADNVVYKKTPRDFKSTVLALIDDLDDEEMIYWCIDDKYPIRLNLEKIEKIYQWQKGKTAAKVDGILFCRCRKMLLGKFLKWRTLVDDAKNVYLERKGYEQIWIHQFLRVKVLRHLFESLPDVIQSAKSMDALKKKIAKPASHRLFVSRENLAVFGESASRGAVTRNCYDSIIENGLSLPEWCLEEPVKEMIMGEISGP